MARAVMLGVLVVAVGIVRLHHIETGYAQPHYHINAGYTYQDVKQSFEPYHAEGNKVYKVKPENTYGQPV